MPKELYPIAEGNLSRRAATKQTRKSHAREDLQMRILQLKILPLYGQRQWITEQKAKDKVARHTRETFMRELTNESFSQEECAEGTLYFRAVAQRLN